MSQTLINYFFIFFSVLVWIGFAHFHNPILTLQDVIKLAVNVETINKNRSSNATRSVAKKGFVKDLTF